MHAFKIIGVAEGIPKVSNTFNAAVKIAATQIKIRYGNITSVYCAPKTYRVCVSSKNARLQPAMAQPTTVIITSQTIAREIALFRKSKPDCVPLFFTTKLKIGTIALDNAPSPSNRRNKFGRLNAKVYALLTAPMPIYAIVSESRTSPSMREPTVAMETFRMFLSFSTLLEFALNFLKFSMKRSSANSQKLSGFCFVAVC